MVTIGTSPTPPFGTFGPFKPKALKKSYAPYLIGLAVVLILGAGYYFIFYQGINLFAATAFPPAPPLSPLEVKVSKLPAFSFEVFDSPFYKSLKVYGSVPVVADSLGRDNPFIPY